mgnify:CR=1 FL=1
MSVPASGGLVRQELIAAARDVILAARERAVRSVDAERVSVYWWLGRLILDEQGVDGRAEYGAYLIRGLSENIVPEFGSGFSVRQLEQARQFCRMYPNANAVRSELNWSQYRTLIRMADADTREFYELQAIRNGWTGRELERQVNSGLFERLHASTDRAAVMAVARGERRPESPSEIVKDPMVLEFLGLQHQPAYYERDLESALITNLQTFLLELGNGFKDIIQRLCGLTS